MTEAGTLKSEIEKLGRKCLPLQADVRDFDKAKEVIEMNQKGIIPEDISAIQQNIETQEKGNSFTNVVGQDSVSRFDKKTRCFFRESHGFAAVDNLNHTD